VTTREKLQAAISDELAKLKATCMDVVTRADIVRTTNELLDRWAQSTELLPVLEYNEYLCITAGELRSSGIKVPGDIPDCGWVPRGAVDFRVSPNREAGVIGVDVTFSVPFKWVQLDVTVEDAK